MQLSDEYIKRGEKLNIEDGDLSVSLTKIFTPNGQRLEIAAPAIDQQIRIDAVEVEAISWQERETILAFLQEGENHGMRNVESKIQEIQETLDGGNLEVHGATEPIEITNEYAEGHVRKLETNAGEYAEIAAPKLDYRIRITPAELASITWQTQETFTSLLENPYGPLSEWTPDTRFRLDM